MCAWAISGSGSDYTPFIQHLGVPSTDIGSDGPYGVYHSVFDNYNWFIKNADPTFVYEQQQARVFGLEILHMADADVLPYDYKTYGNEVVGYLKDAQQRATADAYAGGLRAGQRRSGEVCSRGCAYRNDTVGAGIAG